MSASGFSGVSGTTSSNSLRRALSGDLDLSLLIAGSRDVTGLKCFLLPLFILSVGLLGVMLGLCFIDDPVPEAVSGVQSCCLDDPLPATTATNGEMPHFRFFGDTAAFGEDAALGQLSFLGDPTALGGVAP